MFKTFKKQLQESFDKMIQHKDTLFLVTIDKDAIWQAYLSGFPEETRQSHNCNCCRSYLKNYANVVSITNDNQLQSMWDFTCDDSEYQNYIHI